MFTKELIEYIKTERATGHPDEIIRQNLMNGGGWALSDIQEALAAASGPAPAPAPAFVSPRASVSESMIPPQVRPVADPISPRMIYPGGIYKAEPLPSDAPKRKSGLFVVLIIVLLVVLGGGGFYAYKAGYLPFSKKTPAPIVPPVDTSTQPNTPDTTTPPPAPVNPPAPVVVQPAENPDYDHWDVFAKYNDALKNVDVAAYNAVSYKPVSSDQISAFPTIAATQYTETQKFNKADFIVKNQDGQQAIYSTTAKKADTADGYGYNKSTLFFVKDKDGLWKVLSASSANFFIATKSTKLTPVQIEQELQKMMLDSDNDGITDTEETCTGTYQVSTCVKTDPKNRDTDGDGWWDGIEAKMK